MPEVSVIIPVYNSERWLDRTIKSVLQQEHLKEIILVDDHSTDRSLETIREWQKKFPDIIKVFVNPQKGAQTARNYGFRQSTGEFIQWLDADDQLLPGKFDAQLKAFEQNPQADIVYSDWYMDYYNEHGELIRREERKKGYYADYLYELLKDNWSPPANYLMRRQAAERLYQLGLWNPETPVAQDREYFTIAALEGMRFVYQPGFFSVYNRWSREQTSAMEFRRRLQFQMGLERKFRQIILQKNFSPKRRRKYLACLNAHVLNANYYFPSIGFPFLFSIFNVNWRIIHWKKYPFIPWLYVYETVKFGLKR